MIDSKSSELGSKLDVEINGQTIKGIVVQKPFFDPKKEITSKSI